MTEKSMDDYTLPKTEGGFTTDWKKWGEDLDRVTANLEEKYASRNLKFSMRFRGSVPVQAFGTIDDMQFYFRYRGDCGQLHVGFVAEDRFEKEYERDMMYWEERMEEHAKQKVESAEAESDDPIDVAFEEFYLRKPVKQESKNLLETIPTSIRKTASVVDYLDDPYNGTLLPSQCEHLFSLLVGKLEDIVWEQPIYPEGREVELRASRAERLARSAKKG